LPWVRIKSQGDFGNTGPALVQIDEAKVVCARSEVVDAGLRWAIESGQVAGVWVELSEDERHALNRRTARAGLPSWAVGVNRPVFKGGANSPGSGCCAGLI